MFNTSLQLLIVEFIIICKILGIGRVGGKHPIVASGGGGSFSMTGGKITI